VRNRKSSERSPRQSSRRDADLNGHARRPTDVLSLAGETPSEYGASASEGLFAKRNRDYLKGQDRRNVVEKRLEDVKYMKGSRRWAWVHVATLA
jgi:hypothetical protein